MEASISPATRPLAAAQGLSWTISRRSALELMRLRLSEKREHVPLTAEHIARIEEICAEPMAPTEHMLAAIKRAEKVS